jgi:hypothetical protein
MWFRLHPPFGNQRVDDQKVWEEMVFPDPIAVRDFLHRLQKIHPEMSDYIRQNEEETFHHILLFRQSYIIKREDLIQPDDHIDVIMPLTGG